MNRPLEVPDSFSVDDSYLKNVALQALLQIIRNQIFDLARRKCVEVQHSINR